MDAKKLLYLIACLVSTSSFATNTTSLYAPDPEEQLGPTLTNSYIGAGIGDVYSNTTNQNLLNGYQASSFKNNALGWNAYVGHYFNPYLALEINMLRTVENLSQNATIINGSSPKNDFYFFVYGLTLRPTLPLSKNISLFGEGGYALITRNGFGVNGQQVLPSQNLGSFMTGGGLSYHFYQSWTADFGFEYVFAKPSQQQPSITYGYAGISYLFKKLNLAQHYAEKYLFKQNYLSLGGFSKNLFNVDWLGSYTATTGIAFTYEHTFFHTHKLFEFDAGLNIANYHSTQNQVFQAYSIFPDFRFWVFRSNWMNFFLKFNIAGPTYVSQQYISGKDLGGHFIFYDGIGFGGLFGKEKNVMISAMFAHYSNGGIYPQNSQFQTPLMVSIGYVF